ncbi:MAG: nucleotidyltransferase family protein [Herminiimonas sp.]|nr:nucleotidyltransferase family protein [Herminiimonas sp.]
MSEPSHPLAGILLAAGKGSRFDPSGIQNKLLQPLAGGQPVAAAAAKNLLSVLPRTLAVVRPGATAVAVQLGALGCEVVECPDAGQGMGASLAFAIARTANAAGWLIALADMPYVQAATLQALIDTIANGADIAVPTHAGRRGNPVAFSHRHLPELLALGGDQGARRLLTSYPVMEVAVDDPGIHRDIDTLGDLGEK